MSQKLTRAGHKLLDAATQIWEEDPTEKDTAYIARQMVQATLPHKNPGNIPVWARTNGNLTLAIQAGVISGRERSSAIPTAPFPACCCSGLPRRPSSPRPAVSSWATAS